MNYDAHNIITLPSKQIRAIAREGLSGKWKVAFIGSFIYLAIIAVPTTILGAMDLGFGEAIYNLLCTGAFSYGYVLFLMNLFRNQDADYADLFDGFQIFTKTLVLHVVMSLLIAFQLLLFVIPGIIATFRYSFAYNVMVDHPEYSPMQCIEESKRLTSGNKMKLFCLSFSFIGWAILAGLPSALVTSAWETAAIIAASEGQAVTITLGQQIVSTLLDFPMIFLTPYIMAAGIVLYDLITGRLRPGIVETTANIIDESDLD